MKSNIILVIKKRKNILITDKIHIQIKQDSYYVNTIQNKNQKIINNKD